MDDRLQVATVEDARLEGARLLGAQLRAADGDGGGGLHDERRGVEHDGCPSAQRDGQRRLARLVEVKH